MENAGDDDEHFKDAVTGVGLVVVVIWTKHCFKC